MNPMNGKLFARALVVGGAALTAVAACAASGTPATTVIERPGSGNNHIEVSGNSASRVGTPCSAGTAPGAVANVNSVNIDGRSLQGRSVIVNGRNTRDVQVRGDCDAAQGGAASVNSINIR